MIFATIVSLNAVCLSPWIEDSFEWPLVPIGWLIASDPVLPSLYLIPPLPAWFSLLPWRQKKQSLLKH
jgi:hypothetical protein